jgi:hypothetical protein
LGTFWQKVGIKKNNWGHYCNNWKLFLQLSGTIQRVRELF